MKLLLQAIPAIVLIHCISSIALDMWLLLLLLLLLVHQVSFLVASLSALG